MSILTEINENLQKGRSKAVCNLVETALAEHLDPKDIMQSLLDGMNTVGEKFKRDEVFVPDVMIAARAMNNGLAKLKPYLQEADGSGDHLGMLQADRFHKIDITKHDGISLSVLMLGQ